MAEWGEDDSDELGWIAADFPDLFDSERRRKAELSTAFLVRIKTTPDGTQALLKHARILPRDGAWLAGKFASQACALTHVILRHNRMGDAALEPVFHALRDAPLLLELDIAHTGFEGLHTPSFYELIKNTQKLEVLSLCHNSVSVTFGIHFGPALACNTSLKSLLAVRLPLMTAHVNAILYALWRHPCMKHVYVNDDRIRLDPNMADVLMVILRDNQVLRTLSFRTQGYDADSLIGILGALRENTTLTTLKLGRIIECRDNTFADIDAALTSSLLQNVTLEHFDFYGLPEDTSSLARHLLGRNADRRASRLWHARHVFFCSWMVCVAFGACPIFVTSILT
jgi:hypothetical protein